MESNRHKIVIKLKHKSNSTVKICNLYKNNSYNETWLRYSLTKSSKVPSLVKVFIVKQ